MTASLAELLDANTRRWPERTAVSCGARALTWTQLEQRVQGVAGAMVDASLLPQDRLFFVGRNSICYVETLFAAALADLIFVPLNWRLAAGELAAILADTAVPFVVVEPEFAGLMTQVASLLRSECTIVQADLAYSESALRAGAGPTVSERALRPVSPDHIAFQLYTSGTTGRPKGAMFANGTSVATLLERITVAWDLREDDVSLVTLPLFHMGGLAWLLTSMAGGAQVVLADFDATAVLDICERDQVTTAFFVPAMLPPLITATRGRRRELHLRRLTYSGAPIAPNLLIEAMAEFGCDFVQIYGLTEATGAFAQLDPGDHDPGGPRESLLPSAGRPYPWTETRVCDPATGAAVARGKVGEIWTRSAQNMYGYFNRPAETAAAITPEGWLRTGDIGRYDDDGYLFLLDRLKDVIITGGENVYPVEVENVLATHPRISAVAVVGAPNQQWGETVVAVVVPAPVRDVANELTADDVIGFTRERLASFKCPRRVEFVAELPRTATGKIRKDLVREQYWVGHERRIH